MSKSARNVGRRRKPHVSDVSRRPKRPSASSALRARMTAPSTGLSGEPPTAKCDDGTEGTASFSRESQPTARSSKSSSRTKSEVRNRRKKLGRNPMNSRNSRPPTSAAADLTGEENGLDDLRRTRAADAASSVVSGWFGRLLTAGKVSVPAKGNFLAMLLIKLAVLQLLLLTAGVHSPAAATAKPMLGGAPPVVFPDEPFSFFGAADVPDEPEYKNSLLGFYDYLAEQIADQDPEVTPGLVEGDIATPNALSYYLWRLGLRWSTFPTKKWDNATVPYHISPKYSPTERQTIQTAIYGLSFLTCIQFVPYDGKSKDYLLIWPVEKPSGCWSFIGKQGGQQIVSLERPSGKSSKCLGGPGRAMHEIMHALGVFHEQSRQDRDKYVTVEQGNILPDFVHNFAKVSPRNATFDYEYDFHSIMHYGTRYFSTDKTKRATLVPKKKNVVLGQRLGLSKLDCMKLNHMYGCFDGSEYEKEKYETFCAALGM